MGLGRSEWDSWLGLLLWARSQQLGKHRAYGVQLSSQSGLLVPGNSAVDNSNKLALLGLGGTPTHPVQRRTPMTFMAGPVNKRMARDVGAVAHRGTVGAARP